MHKGVGLTPRNPPGHLRVIPERVDLNDGMVSPPGGRRKAAARDGGARWEFASLGFSDYNANAGRWEDGSQKECWAAVNWKEGLQLHRNTDTAPSGPDRTWKKAAILMTRALMSPRRSNPVPERKCSLAGIRLPLGSTMLRARTKADLPVDFRPQPRVAAVCLTFDTKKSDILAGMMLQHLAALFQTRRN